GSTMSKRPANPSPSTIQNLQLLQKTFWQKRHSIKTRQINGTETAHTIINWQARLLKCLSGRPGGPKKQWSSDQTGQEPACQFVGRKKKPTNRCVFYTVAFGRHDRCSLSVNREGSESFPTKRFNTNNHIN
ncbi:MAG: hypothetical protein ACODTL_00140, partial [Brucella sp.]